jgi:hypothetical protein
MNVLEHYFPITGYETDHAIVRIDGFNTGRFLLFGSVRNIGSASFTLNLAESDDNAVADAYVAITNGFRYCSPGSGAGAQNTTQGTTLTVPAGAQIDFVVQGIPLTARYLRFYTSAVGAQGLLGLFHTAPHDSVKVQNRIRTGETMGT